MRRHSSSAAIAVIILVCSTLTWAAPSSTDHSQHQAMAKSAGQTAKTEQRSSLSIPNVTLVNEQGEEVSVMDDLIKHKIVVLNTIYTTCTTVCPVMGVQYAQLQKNLLKRLGKDKIDKDILLLSISIDPLNDTPERLAAFRDKFGGGPGWTLLTGSQKNVERLLKATGLFTADPQEHTPITLIGSAQLGQWTRLSGLGPVEQIAQMVDDLATSPSVTKLKPLTPESDQKKPPAQQYFTDVALLNQHGQPQRLYSDLLKDKVVIVHSFFSTCKGSCPVAMKLMAGLAERFGDKMGKQLHILSISLDPETDTPPKLQAYAQELEVGPGWQLISGDKQNVDFALKKFGHYVTDIEAHKNTIIIGNETTGLWKKAFLLAKPEQLDQLITSVIDDQLPVTASAD